MWFALNLPTLTSHFGLTVIWYSYDVFAAHYAVDEMIPYWQFTRDLKTFLFARAYSSDAPLRMSV